MKENFDHERTGVRKSSSTWVSRSPARTSRFAARGQVVVEGKAPGAGALGEEGSLLERRIERELKRNRPAVYLTGVRDEWTRSPGTTRDPGARVHSGDGIDQVLHGHGLPTEIERSLLDHALSVLEAR